MLGFVIAALAGGLVWLLPVVVKFWPARTAPAAKRQPDPGSMAAVDYAQLRLTWQQFAGAVLIVALPCAAIGVLFYRHELAALLFGLAGAMGPRLVRRRLIAARSARLQLQFKQALHGLTASMSAGTSLERAFTEALDDLRLLFPDSRSPIIVEFAIIGRKLASGEPIEAAFADFARRSRLAEAAGFSEVLLTCKRTGGNLVEVMRRTAAMMGETLEIKQELAVLLAQKKLEARILLVAPFAIVALLAVSSPDYMQPLYEGVGRLWMSGCLMLLGGCFWLTRRLMDINV